MLVVDPQARVACETRVASVMAGVSGAITSSTYVHIPQLRAGFLAHVVRPVVHEARFEVNDKRVLVNPTGRFVVGGPQGDAGLTGRKIIVDSYGGMARHGGGAFSGKDPSKVDRSATY